MEVSIELIKSLREETGAGINDVKRALDEAGGDVEKAKQALRLAGAKVAAAKQARTAGEGLVVSYVHGSKLGVLVELRCETDFVARSDAFQAVAHDLALHVAASSPLYVRREDVPAEAVEAERALYQQQVAAEGKPQAVAEKIVEGKLAKYYSQVCLLEQPFVKDDSKIIRQVVEELTAKVGEKIEVGSFCRLQLGSAPQRC